MREMFGFSLEVCGSRLEGGGRGVVVREGRVPSGHLVGLYPGTLVSLLYCSIYRLVHVFYWYSLCVVHVPVHV